MKRGKENKKEEKIDIPLIVKWAGGKKQLIEQFKPLFPKKIERYIEPFLGSGAVAFYVIQKYNPSEVLLSDSNEELINVFNTIKHDYQNLIKKLKEHKNKYQKNKNEYYYRIRKQNPERLSSLNKAARFIFLNRTCFNGLYRVNSKGRFNVPIGDHKNPDIVQEEKMKNAAELLKDVNIRVMSFENVIDFAKKGDFAYFDPPYDPLKKGKSFTTYTKDNFLEKDQKKLAEVFDELTRKGCLCMGSNNDTELIREIYSKHNIEIVKAKRMINSDASKRGAINEVVILNY